MIHGNGGEREKIIALIIYILRQVNGSHLPAVRHSRASDALIRMEPPNRYPATPFLRWLPAAGAILRKPDACTSNPVQILVDRGDISGEPVLERRPIAE